MLHRMLPVALVAALITACGATGVPAPGSRTAAQVAASAANVSGTAAIAAFEKKPSLGLVKKPAPIRVDPIMDPPPGLPESLVKIQGLATAGLAEAEKKENWNERFACTDAALQKVDAVKLTTHGLNNVPAKVGLQAARGYGYMGMHPTHENRFKVQAVTLGYMNKAGEEMLLAKGSPLFTMSADMLEVTTGWDQGFRVGISVLTTLKENYKDREISKACQAILDKAVAAPSKEEAYVSMVTGLRELARKLVPTK